MTIFSLVQPLCLLVTCNFRYFSFLLKVTSHWNAFMLIFHSYLLFCLPINESLQSFFLSNHLSLLLTISVIYFYFFHFIFMSKVMLFSESCCFSLWCILTLILTVHFIIEFSLFINFLFYLYAILSWTNIDGILSNLLIFLNVNQKFLPEKIVLTLRFISRDWQVFYSLSQFTVIKLCNYALLVFKMILLNVLSCFLSITFKILHAPFHHIINFINVW